jgi:predicted nucleotidyltransferase
MHPAIAQHRSGISAICQRYRISRLEVFGSATRADDFNPASSDADFLVAFAPDALPQGAAKSP